MNNEVSYWNNVFSGKNDAKSKYDLWLNKYDQFLSMHKDIDIIDLGCGWGDDESYLLSRGYKVIACDFSIEAIKHIKQQYPEAKTIVLNMLERLPFSDESAFCIISDLSIHYFSYENTMRIISEISRVFSYVG
jgi:ubiquinone/menaquinone biosynthesis C-methylase UbiE